MMYEEFERLAGYEVSADDYYNVIEPMYMAFIERNPAMTKQDFIKLIDRKRFALKTRKELISEMKKIAKHLKETCEFYGDNDAYKKLHSLKHEFCNRHGYKDGIVYFAHTYPGDRGCTYPNLIVFYDNNFKTTEEVELIRAA